MLLFFHSILYVHLFSSTMNRSGQKIMLLPLFFITVIAVFLSVSGVVVVAAVAEDDVRCLKGLKNALKDPHGKLDSWRFSDPSVAGLKNALKDPHDSWRFSVPSVAGFICKFTGASCWNEKENRVISLQLPSMDLAGKIPDSLQYCGSLQTLDLSGNKFSGTIPSQICDWVPYVVTLDLSRNELSGPIPPELAKCKFLNNLMLGNNHLSGPIPYELVTLDRLKKFSVANNDLTGQIPSFMAGFDPDDFSGNSYSDPVLCGRPLYITCRGEQEYLGIGRDAVILASVVYFVVTVFSSWCWYWLLFAEIKRKTPNNQIITRQRTSRGTRLSSVLPSTIQETQYT